MENRKDSKGRVLKSGERERVNNDGYEFRYTRRGKTHSIYASTLQRLREKEEILRNEVFVGNSLEGKNITVNQVYERWRKLKRGIKSNTFSNYQYMYEKYVYDSFGKLKIKDVRRSDIKEFYIELAEEKGLKANTIDNIQNVIYQIFEMAVDDDFIRSNPANRALTELKRSGMFTSKEREALTKNQEKELINYLENDIKQNCWLPIIIFMLRTGMRIGEVSALQYDDIDFENNVIHVRKTLVYYDQRKDDRKCVYEIHEPKTPTSVRDIPMFPKVREALLKEKENQKLFGIRNELNVDGYENFMFLNRFGKPYNQGTINKALKTIIQNCNSYIITRDNGNQDNLVPRISSHIFRHTFATRINEAGMNDKVRQYLLGHKSIQTTDDIYTDVDADHIKKEVERARTFFED